MASHRQKTADFVALTGLDEKRAAAILGDCGWNVQRAAESYFEMMAAAEAGGPRRGSAAKRRKTPPAAAPAFDRKACETLFNRYKDPHEDKIHVEGVEQLCKDLGVEPSDVAVLVLAWHLKAANVCEFRRQEWLDGCSELQCHSIDALRAQLPAFRRELDDPALFKQIYQFTFAFAKSETSRSLPLDMAIAYWTLLFSNRFKYLDLWTEFMEDHYKKAVSRDTWNLFLEFSDTIRAAGDFGKHDFMGAWPVVIDSFVEWVSSEKRA